MYENYYSFVHGAKESNKLSSVIAFFTYSQLITIQSVAIMGCGCFNANNVSTPGSN